MRSYKNKNYTEDRENIKKSLNEVLLYIDSVRDEEVKNFERYTEEKKKVKVGEYNPLIHKAKLPFTRADYITINEASHSWNKYKGKDKKTQKTFVKDIDDKYCGGGQKFTVNMLNKVLEDPNKELLVLCDK